MDSQRKRLQGDILTELKLRGVKNSLKNVKTWDETTSEIVFKMPTPLSSVRYPANVREPEIKKEIVQKVNEISLPECKANEILQSVTRDLKTVFGSIDIQVNGKRVMNEWDVYGSFKNGLCCNDSDIDFHNGSFENLPNADAVNLLNKIWHVFKNNAYFDGKRYYETARVPLVILKHKRTGKECSITFSGKMGVYDSLLTKLYLEHNSKLKDLTLFLKHVLVRHNLHGTGKITTHMIFLLVVFFMQQKQLLWPVKDVRQAAVRKNYVRNWNYSVPDSYPKRCGYSSEESIVSLYCGFLEFYKNFDFLKYVISPYFGYAVPIENFETLDIPREAYIGQRYPNVNGDGLHSFTRKSMNIQDVSTLTLNLTANVSLKVVNEFRVVCEHLFKNCEKALNEGHPFKISSESELESMKRLYKNINQTASFELDFKSLKAHAGNLKEYLINASYNLMEIVLGFKCNKIISQEVTVVDRKQGDPVVKKVPVLYMDYITTYATLRNKYVLSMFEESSSSLRENFEIFFLFEIREDLERVRLLVEGDGRFVEFMDTCGKKLFVI